MCDIGTGHGFSAKPASTGWDPLRIARAWIELMKRLGYTDSPIGLAAWMLDHDPKSYQLIARAFAGNPGGLSRDDVLDNVTPGFLRLSSTGKTSSDSSSSRASRFRLGSASFRTSFTKRHAIPSDDDYGRSRVRGFQQRYATAGRDVRSEWVASSALWTQGTLPYSGLTAVVLGQGSMTRFSDPELNLSRRIGDT